jgi:DNA-binding response OmpR family regulator
MLTSGAEMASRILVVDDSPTIRRVVSTILERNGFEAPVASDGQDALDALTSGEVKADLVLLDFVMPRMNGYQFCRELRAHATLAGTPVVLMSAKGDRIRDQFVQQTGAIDAITKPFDAQALVAVIENALRRVSTHVRASSARLPENEPEEQTAEGNEFETRRTNVAQIVAQKLAKVVVAALEEKPQSTQGELLKLLAARFEKEAIVEMVEAVRDLDKGETGPILSGDLGVVPIGAVLQLLQAENQTGVLVCRGANAEVTATFRNGLIDLVQSSGAGDEFRLGRFFVDEGILSAAEIDELLKRGVEDSAPLSSVHVKDESDPTLAPPTVRQDMNGRITMPGTPGTPASARPVDDMDLRDLRPRLLGAMLLEAKKVDEAQLRSALTRQSSELLYDVLRWPKGRFSFRREPATDVATTARLGLPVASVVMEGFRRVDEWRALEKTLGSFDSVLVRDDLAFGSLDASQLPDREKKVLDLVDGERTVRQVIAASHMSSFDACRILVQFLEARVLRARS